MSYICNCITWISLKERMEREFKIEKIDENHVLTIICLIYVIV